MAFSVGGCCRSCIICLLHMCTSVILKTMQNFAEHLHIKVFVPLNWYQQINRKGRKRCGLEFCCVCRFLVSKVPSFIVSPVNNVILSHYSLISQFLQTTNTETPLCFRKTWTDPTVLSSGVERRSSEHSTKQITQFTQCVKMESTGVAWEPPDHIVFIPYISMKGTKEAVVNTRCIKSTMFKMCLASWVALMPLLCSLVLEIELTRVLDRQGTNLFDIYEPNVLPQDVSIIL